MKNYVIEFIGTFFLVLTIGLTAGNALAIGAVLAALVYMGGYISGAHFNPAVTLAIYMRKGIRLSQVGIYMLVQLLAAIAAAEIYQAVQGSKMLVAPGEGVSMTAALIVEVLFTFALVSVVLHTAVSKVAKGNEYYGIAIGFVLMAAVFAGGKISGGAYNPAVGLGPNLYDIGALHNHLSHLWLYVVGPFVGGALASLVFGLTQEKEHTKSEKVTR